MSSDRWLRIEELFGEALDRPASERAAFLEGACAGDRELLAEVRRLLDGDTRPGAELLEAGYPADLMQDTLTPEQVIGPYRILELLGEGGMGQVYLAEQTQPVERRVALKLIKLGMDTQAVLRRFEVERQALARMEHDCIAKVFDAGTTESGQSFFVMEYVDGSPLVAYCEAQQMSLRARLELFCAVCEGVQHAHQKGIIHRDLKPSNILISEQGGHPVPKIIDFGIAKATDQDHAATLFTEQGHVIGTPEYMSPEQASLTSDDLDTRSDVYALGVILYELLTGALPFSHEELRRGGLAELQRKIREDEAPRPSTRVASSERARELRGDLDWIVMRALEKDRERRYGTPMGLAEDVRRHLQFEPVEAGPPSRSYRIRKFVRRYRLQVSAAVAVLVVLIGGIVGTSIGMIQAERQTLRAQRQEAIATERAAEIARQNDEIQKTAVALRARTDEFDMLSSVVHLRRAQELERSLYPPWPEKAEPMQRWLAQDAARLREALPRLRRTVAQLEQRVEGVGPAPASESSRFLYSTLQGAVGEIEAFEAVIQDVERRLEWARGLDALTVDHPQARARWDVARAAIRAADGEGASVLYRSEPPLELVPQAGLVPIGKNPETGLWEFYHLRSAWDPNGSVGPGELVIPEHDPVTGEIPIDDGTGVVFVLIPGGLYPMGAQSDDPDRTHYDPGTRRGEGPVHEVPLDAFFLARHELTQGQWMRLSGGVNPSIRTREESSFVGSRAHPVEGVDWNVSADLLGRYGLVLPTEAQWEAGCRAGTDSPWWCGDERESLLDVANLADQSAGRAGATWVTIGDWPEFDDGFVMHAPVDALASNPFGLHHVHGNVAEWCLDRMGDYQLPHREGDGLRTHLPGESGHAVRGGHYLDKAADLRSARRGTRDASVRTSYVGVRAARPVRD